MMKFRTTQKAIKNNYKNIICVPYCGLQHLLSHETEFAYTARREGWAADIYEIGNVAIVTGYAPFGNIRPDYETRNKYENKAAEIRAKYYEYETCKNRLRHLLDEFINEVIR